MEKTDQLNLFVWYFGKHKPIAEPVSAWDSHSVMYEKRWRQIDGRQKV